MKAPHSWGIFKGFCLGNFCKWLYTLPLKILIYSILLQEPFTGTVQHHLNDTLLLGTSVECQCTSANGTFLKVFECVSTTFVCFPDSSFWRAFYKLETHYILEFLMFHFFAEKIYSFSTTGGFVPRSSLKTINTNKYLCCGAGKTGFGRVQMEHQRDCTTIPS